VIASEKLVDYLLKPRPWDDKSGYLARAGFGADAPEQLEHAIRTLAGATEATNDGTSAYGIFWKAQGELAGPGGRTLPVVLIWMQRYMDGRFHLVTLRPPRRDERGES
jgi:hypothetical protein